MYNYHYISVNCDQKLFVSRSMDSLFFIQKLVSFDFGISSSYVKFQCNILSRGLEDPPTILY